MLTSQYNNNWLQDNSQIIDLSNNFNINEMSNILSKPPKSQDSNKTKQNKENISISF